MSKLQGSKAIGHVRYSTAGKKSSFNCQPISAETDAGFLSLAHNGNLTNAEELKAGLISKGAIFHPHPFLPVFYTAAF